jgi:hypothetical protein
MEGQQMAQPENFKNNSEQQNHQAEEQTVPVLYQKMGDRWFAFSVLEDEVFVGSISQDEIDSSLVGNS